MGTIRTLGTLLAFAFTLTFGSIILHTLDAAELVPVSPGRGEVVSLRTEVQNAYRSPDERGWNTGYNPAELKTGTNECSHQAPVHLSWIWTGAPAEFTVRLAEAGKPGIREFKTTETSFDVTNLDVDSDYTWTVSALGSFGAAESPSLTFKTPREWPQWWSVPGISNVRDSGGLDTRFGRRIRMGKIYRGTEMDGHFALEDEGRDIMLNEIGIKTDLDLRGPDEWNNKPGYYSPLGYAVKWVDIPLRPYSEAFSDENKELYRILFKLLAREDTYPVYIHCYGGADRTGTVVMLLHGILGASDSDIARGYEMTSFSVVGNRTVCSGLFKDFTKELAAYGDPEASLSENMEKFLLAIGVTEGEIATIRSILLEDAP